MVRKYATNKVHNFFEKVSGSAKCCPNNLPVF